MGKKLTNPYNKKTIKQLEKAICKKKNLSANLEEFVKKLIRKHQHITTKEYLIRIHNYIHNYKAILNTGEDTTKPAFKFGRVCKQCGDWKDRHKMVECMDCEDYYHIDCLEDKEIDRKHWKCSLCIDIQQNITRENTLERHYGKAQSSEKLKKKCNKCKDVLNSKIASCMKCRFQYHFKCFGNEDSNVIVCGNCHSQIQEQIRNRKSLKQKTLYDFFQAKDTDEWSKMEKSEASTIHDQLTISFCSSLNLKAPIKLSQQQINLYKKQLLYAIYSKKMEYSQQLVFESEVPWDVYYQDLSIQYINKKDEQSYITYKKQPIGPYKIVMIQGIGYDVKADKDIPKGTIICQYIGQVITKRQAQHQLHNDSLMELMMGVNADSSLVIKPEKFTNMARFINGVNENDPVLSKKANVMSIKIGICGRPTILLYTSKKVNKGDSLLYNYNGGLQFYQTSQFM